jgi:hypothetical protein
MAYNNTTGQPVGQLNENHGIAATGLNQPGTAPIAGATGEHPLHHEHKHQGRETVLAAGAAGLAGHELTERGHTGHHYGRDAAAAAALGGHELHKHENKHANDAVGGIDSKPSIGDKIKGNVEKVAGKVTGNEAKVIKGENIAQGRSI